MFNHDLDILYVNHNHFCLLYNNYEKKSSVIYDSYEKYTKKVLEIEEIIKKYQIQNFILEYGESIQQEDYINRGKQFYKKNLFYFNILKVVFLIVVFSLFLIYIYF